MFPDCLYKVTLLEFVYKSSLMCVFVCVLDGKRRGWDLHAVCSMLCHTLTKQKKSKITTNGEMFLLLGFLRPSRIVNWNSMSAWPPLSLLTSGLERSLNWAEFSEAVVQSVLHKKKPFIWKKFFTEKGKEKVEKNPMKPAALQSLQWKSR